MAHSQGTARPTPFRTLPVLTVHLAVLSAWLLAFLAAALLEYAPHASLWFPPAAVSFAALLVLGARALPALWLACFAATLITDLHYRQDLPGSTLILSAVTFAFCHTLAYGFAAGLLRRMAQRASGDTMSLGKVTAILLGGALASGLAALLGAYGLAWSGMIPVADVPALLVPWWIGDYAGLIALGPLATVLLARLAEHSGLSVEPSLPRLSPRLRPGTGRSSFLPKFALLMASSLLVLLGASLLPEQKPLLFTLFLAVIVQLWIVHTERELAALISVAAFSLLLAGATPLLGLGDQALTLQFALISLAANSYFGLAVPALYADNARLRSLLTHDALTGALSRAFFEDRAREGVAIAEQRGQAAALVVLDLDLLKQINDVFGHPAGDAALQTLVATCQRCLRPGDALGRLSGDEFAAFLPDTDRTTAAAVVERMRTALGQTESSPDGRPLRASFGIAVYESGSLDYPRLLARADAAMYEDKQRGRLVKAA